MSPTFTVGQTPQTLGGLLSLSARLLFRTRPMLRIAAVVMLPFAVLQITGAGVALLQTAAMLGDGQNVLLALSVAAIAVCIGLANVLPYLAYPWMEGALAHRVIEESLGRIDRGVRGTYAAVGRRWPALFASSVLRQLAAALLGALMPAVARGVMVAWNGDPALDVAGDWLVAVGVLALCGPIGLVATILLVRVVVDWSLRAPVIVAEGVGVFAALRRSRMLIQGHRWRMLGRLIPVALLQGLFVALPALLFTSWLGAPEAQPWMASAAPAALIVGAIGVFFLAPYEAIFLVLNYLDLRVRRENLLSELAGATDENEVAAAAVAVTTEDPALTAPSTPAQRIISLQQRIRHEGESCPLWIDLAQAFQQVGDLGAALDALERAHKLTPSDPEILLAIAGVHQARRDSGAARAALYRYIALEPGEAAIGNLRQDSQWRALLDDVVKSGRN